MSRTVNQRNHFSPLRRKYLGTAATLSLTWPLAGWAQQTSGQSGTPLRIYVPFSAGALTDVIARIYAERLAPRLGVPVLVENRPGASGVTASQALLAAPADGNTMMFVSSSHAVNTSLRARLPYNTETDFAGLALLASSPSLVVVRHDHPARSLRDLLAMAKNQPGKISYGSAGVGAATHLVGEYLAMEAAVRMLHIPYKGVQEAVTDVAGGQIDLALPPIALALPLIKSGRIRALAVTSPQGVPSLPDVPTVAEQGLAGFDYRIWYALVMSAKTPRPAMEALAQKVVQVSEEKEVIDRLSSQGLIPMVMTLRDFDKFISAEIQKLGQIVRASGMKPE